MQRYEAYKDSGVEWIGEIPEGWGAERLKTQLEERKESNNPIKTDFILSLTNTRGVIPYSEKGDIGNKAKEDLSSYRLARPGDIVLNSMNVVIGSVGLSRYFGAVSPVYYMLFPRDEQSDVRYFNYIFQMPAFQDSLKGLGNGIMEIRMRIPMSKLNDVKLPIPSTGEQRAIADYLDEKTAEIDSIVSQTDRSIELLREYRKSVISEAVTKGLDPDAPMRDSGIEWIGEIPAGWEVTKFRWVLERVSRDPLPDDEVVTCFRDGEVTLRTNRRTDGFTMSDKEIGYQHICRGDFVIHGMDGFAGAMGISDSEGKASPVLMAFNARGAEDLRYINYLLRFYAWQDVFLSLSTTIRVRSCDLNWGKVAPIPVTLPFPREQQAIADYLDAKTAEIDSLIADKQRQVELLKEYRKSLISEAVTGKFKVPGLE